MQVQEAFRAFDNFPELMRLHLIMNFPTVGWNHMKLLDPDTRLQERSRIQQSWALTSMLASAYQTASPSIDVRNHHPTTATAYPKQEIHARREQALIEQLSKSERL